MKTTRTTALMLADYLEEEPLDSTGKRIVEELRRQHARIQELEEFASAISQYGVLIRAGGAAPHDLKDLSAALAQCVELAQGVLK